MNIISCSFGKDHERPMMMNSNALRKAWIGIVPIVNGCSALYTEDHRIKFLYWPGNLKLLVGTIKIWTQAYRVELAGIEHLTSLSEMNGTSSFYVGYNAGVYEGIMSALSIPFLLVSRENRQLIDAEMDSDNSVLSNADITITGKPKEYFNLKTRALTLAIYAKQIAKSRENGVGRCLDFHDLVKKKQARIGSNLDDFQNDSSGAMRADICSKPLFQ
jgi:hypothetical protein